jgi:hypothetical protein
VIVLFYKSGKPAGWVRRIQPAWTNGPELIVLAWNMNVGSIRWLSHALEDGMFLRCPD